MAGHNKQAEHTKAKHTHGENCEHETVEHGDQWTISTTVTGIRSMRTTTTSARSLSPASFKRPLQRARASCSAPING
ncbi:hypothetical protein GCM10009767_08010 [Kocuria aegyptia]|uniref:Uncharacterized protein n=1 Tax=Kocuria aegyptia TaxID=330943 RepID=A0ABN2K9U8_9MICC